jgi:hypothetical protein
MTPDQFRQLNAVRSFISSQAALQEASTRHREAEDNLCRELGAWGEMDDIAVPDEQGGFFIVNMLPMIPGTKRAKFAIRHTSDMLVPELEGEPAGSDD